MFRIAGEKGVRSILSLILLLAVICPREVCRGFSLLTHEQVVDMLWRDDLTPLLLKRFPAATEQDLRKAHAYAYGGCLIQDMGYYPLGNMFFSDLTHYVRSGDFVSNLINESANLNEYAFALGALAHYVGDNSGHPFINRAVGLSFPKLRKKFGEEVTYEVDPREHIRVEFGFDMTQVAKNRYTAGQYHDFIGFEVSKPVLERAFLRTYGLPLESVVKPVDLSIGTFRRSASRLIPELTRLALKLERSDKVKDKENADQKLFLYHLSRSDYEREWGKEYHSPGFISRVFAFVFKLTPKIGPLRAVDFKVPTSETEDLYIKAVNQTVAQYRQKLRQAAEGRIELPNLDFDTGRKSRAGEYVLSDKTYMKLLDKLSKGGGPQLQPDLRENILAYFSEPSRLRVHSYRERKAWRKALAQLNTLQHESGPWHASVR